MIKFQIVRKSRSLKNAFQNALDHFTDVSNMVVHGSGSVKMICDIAITRFVYCFAAR